MKQRVASVACCIRSNRDVTVWCISSIQLLVATGVLCNSVLHLCCKSAMHVATSAAKGLYVSCCNVLHHVTFCSKSSRAALATAAGATVLQQRVAAGTATVCCIRYCNSLACCSRCCNSVLQ
jgi:hypothetical protein